MQRSHLVDGVGHQGVPPEDDGAEEGPVRVGEDEDEEVAPEGGREEGRQPEVGQDEEVGEVTEVKEEVVVLHLLVSVPAVYY